MASGVYVRVKSRGNYRRAKQYLNNIKDKKFLRALAQYGEKGVQALREATPKRTGLTANSWGYRIEQDGNRTSLIWYNTNIVKDYFNVAVMIQYGHATRNGGWIKGIDYINPALRPIFDNIINNIEVEVRRS